MKLSKSEADALRERCDNTKSGIKGAAACAGISDRVVHKALNGEDVDASTILLLRYGVDAIERVDADRARWISSLQPVAA